MFVVTLSLPIQQSHMHTESAYDGCTAYCYPEQGMVDRLLRVHIQSQRAFWPLVDSELYHGIGDCCWICVCTRESRNLALANVVFDWCIAAPAAALALADSWRSQVSR